jgi:hypothetical protein
MDADGHISWLLCHDDGGVLEHVSMNGYRDYSDTPEEWFEEERARNRRREFRHLACQWVCVAVGVVVMLWAMLG